MNVELPSGCNIINSATSFYNYTNSNRTRSLYYIYEGKAILSNSTTSTNAYTYTGTCLTTGDLKYKPELEVYLPVISFMLICMGLMLIYWAIFRRFTR